MGNALGCWVQILVSMGCFLVLFCAIFSVEGFCRMGTLLILDWESAHLTRNVLRYVQLVDVTRGVA